MPPTPWGFDTTDDFGVVDYLETVEVRRQTPAGTYELIETTEDGGRAWQEVPRRKTSAMVENVDLIWHLDRARWPTLDRVHAGDLITNLTDNSQWVVTYCDAGGLYDEWVCGCTRAVSTEPDS